MGVAVLELCLAALASGLAGGKNRYVLEKLFLKMQGLVSIRDMELVESMRRGGVRPIELIYTTLIAAHGKASGGTAAAIPRIVEEMRLQGVAMGLASYNAIITVCARRSDAAGVVEWMRRLEAAGIEPNSITYNKLVEALVAGGHGGVRGHGGIRPAGAIAMGLRCSCVGV
ncbi:hypothetical protein SELMODRAFT_402833 [Selaginella moellendorffii]|uniref:Pentacotripeptide-repeat region of PRORP domain-containing protein n=1 Tax=Selaginella moellendorffii TaxID=88036 RepID=D8QN68_SELML|nr:hypothetical protein SELMODRAFT_402833 [Selaginella moellendorffii]